MQRVQAALKAQLTRQNEKLEIELREKVVKKFTYKAVFIIEPLLRWRLWRAYVQIERTLV